MAMIFRALSSKTKPKIFFLVSSTLSDYMSNVYAIVIPAWIAEQIRPERICIDPLGAGQDSPA